MTSARLILCVLCVSLPARAETVSVFLLDAGAGTGAALAGVLRRTVERELREQSSLDVRASGFRPPPGCTTDVACLEALPEKAGTTHVFVLRPRLQETQPVLDAYWVDGPRQDLQTRQGRPAEDAEGAGRALVEQLLPAHGRRGYGGLWVEGAPGSVVKVDGRRVASLPLDAPVVLPAGQYGVDVVASSGEAVYRPQRVREGERLSVAAVPRNATYARTKDTVWMRWTSYGLWGAGTLAVAGAFVAGTLGHRVEAGIQSCAAGSRDCASIDEARAQQARTASYARIANRLVGLGVILGTGGAALFGYSVHRAAAPEVQGEGAAP